MAFVLRPTYRVTSFRLDDFETYVSLDFAAPVKDADLVLAPFVHTGITAPASPGSEEGSNAGLGLGFIQYAMNTPITLNAGERTFIDLSGLIENFHTTSDEIAAHPFFTPEGKFDPYGTTLFSEYRIRFNFEVTSTVVDNQLRTELDIGGSQGVIESASESAFSDAGVQELISPLLTFYAASTFKANGGSVFVTSDVNAVINSLVLKLNVDKIGTVQG